MTFMKFLSAHFASSRVFPHYFFDYKSLMSKFCAKRKKVHAVLIFKCWTRKTVIHPGKIFFDLNWFTSNFKKEYISFLFNYSLYVLTTDSGFISLWCFLLKDVTSNQKVSVKTWKSGTSKNPFPNVSLGKFQRLVGDVCPSLESNRTEFSFQLTMLILFVLIDVLHYA